jgi:hypothetical protein
LPPTGQIQGLFSELFDSVRTSLPRYRPARDANCSKFNMTRATRVSPTALTALVVGALGIAACDDSNPPSIRYTREASIHAPGQDTGGTAGSTATSDSGGSAAVSGAGASTATDAGAAGTGAATRPYACASDWLTRHTLCGITQAKEGVAKNIACVPEDQQLCYKTCGPTNSGFKSETCSGGIYVEQSDCSFDSACDFSCFTLPDVADPVCPKSPPMHGGPCTLPPCVVCGGTSEAQTTGYLDSKGSAKIGFCVCVPPTETTTQKWSCATAGTAWPCPGNRGC